jgi:hypothetical protein
MEKSFVTIGIVSIPMDSMLGFIKSLFDDLDLIFIICVGSGVRFSDDELRLLKFVVFFINDDDCSEWIEERRDSL